MLRATIAVLMVTAAPAWAAAQQAGATATANGTIAVSTSQAQASATGDAAADARIEAAATRLAAAGVSSASLASRVQLGLARGVEPARIAASVEQRADALLTADRTLRASGSARGEGTLELAADALESGARASQVAQVVTGFEAEAHTRALAALGALAAAGNIGANVVASVRGAMDAGLGADAAAGTAGTAASAGATGAVNAAGGVGGAAANVGAAAGGTLRTGLPR